MRLLQKVVWYEPDFSLMLGKKGPVYKSFAFPVFMGQIPPEKRHTREKKYWKLRYKFTNGLLDKDCRKSSTLECLGSGSLQIHTLMHFTEVRSFVKLDFVFNLLGPMSKPAWPIFWPNEYLAGMPSSILLVLQEVRKDWWVLTWCSLPGPAQEPKQSIWRLLPSWLL